jgi:hypothetical protein
MSVVRYNHFQKVETSRIVLENPRGVKPMSLRISVTIILAVLFSIACSTDSGGIKDEVVTLETSAGLADRVKQELTYEEVQLLEGYVARVFPDLREGELPSGRSIGEMIEAQRQFLEQNEVAGEPTDAAPETDQPAAIASTESPQQVAAQQPAATAGAESPQQIAPQQAAATEPAPEVQETPPPPSPPATITLPKGTSLQLRLAGALSSKTNQAGESFEAILDQDLEAEDKPVAPAGSRIVGKITQVAASGKVQGRAQMSLTVEKLYVAEELYALRTNTLNFEAESTAKKDATRIGIGAGAGAIIGAIAGGKKGAAIGTAIGAGAGTGVTLATPGDEVEFASEQLFEFRLEEPVEMKILPE